MAGIGFEVTIVGTEKLKTALTKETITDPLAESIKKITRFLLDEVKMATPVDEDILRASITGKATPTWGQVGTNKNYSTFVEYGTRAHWPPIAPLEEWARRHGMPKGTGFLIARKISRVGTKAQHKEGALRVYGLGMFGYGMSKLQERIGEFIKDLGQAIKVKWG